MYEHDLKNCYTIGYQDSNKFLSKLPLGPVSSNHSYKIVVRAIDEFGGYSEYIIDQSVQILPPNLLFDINSILKLYWKSMYESDSQELCAIIVNIVSHINYLNIVDKLNYSK